MDAHLPAPDAAAPDAYAGIDAAGLLTDAATDEAGRDALDLDAKDRDAPSPDATALDALDPDAGSELDASADAARMDSGCVGAGEPPRLLRPTNGAVASVRPSFRWRSVCDASYEIEVDDSCPVAFGACTFPSPEYSASGLRTTLVSADLPVSARAPVGRRYYWHVRACTMSGCGPWSAVWYLDVGRRRGDTNGDGFADLASASYRAYAGAVEEGNAYVFLGGTTGVSTSPSLTLDNPDNQAGGHFGWSVGSAGDVNGDGYGDLLVGARDQNAGAAGEGNVFVYLGGPTGVPTTPTSRLDNPANQANASFGYSVAAAGDVNGDGYADVIVGAPRQDAGATNEGNAFVYFGGPTGLSPTPEVSLDNPINQATGWFGTSVAAGDVNGDGFSDVIIGAYLQDAGASDEGNAFVYYGGPSGPPTSPDVTLDDPPDQPAAFFGASITSADLNDDGYDDVVVGAYQQTAGAFREGNVFVYLGGPSGVPATPSSTLDNPYDESQGDFGRSLTWSDMNDDGIADLIVGAPRQDAGATDEGNAFVYFGASSGVAPSPDIILDNPENQEFGNFGFSVSGGADLNGDGVDDLVVGAVLQDAGAIDEGNVFVYLDGPTGVSSPSATLDSPTGASGAFFGHSVTCPRQARRRPVHLFATVPVQRAARYRERR